MQRGNYLSSQSDLARGVFPDHIPLVPQHASKCSLLFVPMRAAHEILSIVEIFLHPCERILSYMKVLAKGLFIFV